MVSKKERPEVYALRQDGTSWQISRRDFLKAAGLGAAVMGFGLNTRFVKPAHAASDLETLCQSAPAHKDPITGLMISEDGKYLLSCDSGSQQKCWDFASHALESSEKAKDNNEELRGMTVSNGNQLALKTVNNSIRPVVLPDLNDASGGSIKVNLSGVSRINGLDVDLHGNIYGVSGDILFKLNREGTFIYTDQDTLYKISDDNKLMNISNLSDGRFLFILRQKGFSLFDVQSETLQDYDDGNAYEAYAVLPGGARVLLCAKGSTTYRLTSLSDGHVIWKKDLDQNILSAAVTPDGTYGILAGAKKDIVLVSMDDGAVIHRLTSADMTQASIAVAKDGTSCAVSVNKSILFISLPDFEIIGCPVDLKEMKDDTKGIEVTGTDPVTGRTVTYTLPCGSPIPEGAVCVCNCVEGSVCSCVGHVVCTCDSVCSCVGNTYTYCSCDTVCTCEGDGHYWYPD